MAATRKQTMRYQYDALGRRVRRYIAGGRENTKFTYDGLDVVMDDDAVTGVTKYQNGLGIDDKLSLKNGGVTKYFLADHLGSTVALTNSGGAVSEQTSYDSFGNQTTNLSTRYQFTGREYDQFSGFYYYRARWYDAGLGRFISEDPIGFGGGDVNLYPYVRNQPLIFRDPRGLYPGVDVLSNTRVLSQAATALGTAGGGIITAAGAAATSPLAVGAGGLAIGVGIGLPVGVYTANHPSNPFVNGPLNPFGPPAPAGRPISPPYCQPTSRPIPLPRGIPLERSPAVPIPMPTPDREGCAEEISGCVQMCSRAAGDPDQRNVFGGSFRACMDSCVPDRCKGNGGYQP